MDVGKSPILLDNQDTEGKASRLAPLIESCHGVSTKKDFLLHVYPKLCLVIPHDMFACAIGAAGQGRFDHCVNVGFPDDYIRRVFSPDGRIRSPVVTKWAESMRPQYFDRLSLDHLQADPRWKSAFVQYGLSNVGGHGFVDAQSGTASFFAFGGVRDWERHAADVLPTIVPYLHLALTNALRVQVSLRDDMLSPREHEVLRWICRGKSNREIGSILGISPWTVKIHVRNILDKLQVKTRSHAAAKALHVGLVRLD